MIWLDCEKCFCCILISCIFSKTGAKLVDNLDIFISKILFMPSGHGYMATVRFVCLCFSYLCDIMMWYLLCVPLELFIYSLLVISLSTQATVTFVCFCFSCVFDVKIWYLLYILLELLFIYISIGIFCKYLPPSTKSTMTKFG